jgi:hypothetical protein
MGKRAVGVGLAAILFAKNAFPPFCSPNFTYYLSIFLPAIFAQ